MLWHRWQKFCNNPILLLLLFQQSRIQEKTRKKIEKRQKLSLTLVSGSVHVFPHWIWFSSLRFKQTHSTQDVFMLYTTMFLFPIDKSNEQSIKSYHRSPFKYTKRPNKGEKRKKTEKQQLFPSSILLVKDFIHLLVDSFPFYTHYFVQFTLLHFLKTSIELKELLLLLLLCQCLRINVTIEQRQTYIGIEFERIIEKEIFVSHTLTCRRQKLTEKCNFFLSWCDNNGTNS